MLPHATQMCTTRRGRGGIKNQIDTFQVSFWRPERVVNEILSTRTLSATDTAIRIAYMYPPSHAKQSLWSHYFHARKHGCGAGHLLA